MKLKLKLVSLAALALVSSLASAADAGADGRKTYIVQLKDEPAVSYQGGVAGLAATQPARGARFQSRTPAVQAYVNYLARQQRQVAATIGAGRVLANYDTVFNGFSASLTAEELAKLKANANVAAVFEDEARKMDTISTPRFLGLSTPGGLWSQTVAGSALKGEGMVIGVVDGGIWPEGPAFADRVDGNGVPVFSGGTLAFGAAPVTFTGSCVAGEGFVPARDCNNKLVGAKFYNAGFLASGNRKNWSEFYSPRDSAGGNLAHGGHGDHTASTAAGNSGATAVVAGIQMGQASGMAPRARVAAYKICWSYDDPAATDGTGSSNSCFNSDAVSAIDDAVKDGVNAINYSISGSLTSVADPVEQAFYRASLAGVFVAASAGNSGPAQAVAHISPWLATVAASTHDRNLQADTQLGNGAKYSGASLNTTVLPSKPLVNAENSGVAGADPTNLSLCFSKSANGGVAVLDPAKVAGKIVVCTRGTNARVDKSAAVLEAGGVGMVMVDNGAGLVAEAHSVPTVHVTAADGALIKSYANTAGATANIGAFYAGIKPAPVMASFSSRGPNAGDSNILKPDLTAPGVDVIASVSPALTEKQIRGIVTGSFRPGPDWASYQGTSMSSPHVAGLSLLLKQAHPTWSPAAIKSALMTTAYTTLDDGVAGQSNGLLPWSQGAGHVNPNVANDPGLVYDAGKADYVAYQCKVNKAAIAAADCTTYGTLDETYNLNLPSITVGGVVGTSPVIVRRSVTNVGATTATYNATATVPGFTTVVTPSSLTLTPGQTKSFTVQMTAAGAADSVWSFGELKWTDGSHVVRSPVQARLGKAISVTDSLTANTVSGTRLLTVKTGFSGRMGAIKGGLKDVTLAAPVTLAPAPLSSATLKSVCTAGVDTANVKVIAVTMPASTVVARFALRNEDTGAPGQDDFDMMIMKSDNSVSLYSGSDGSNEAVQIASPSAGSYKVCVVAYGTGSGATTMSFKLSSWVVTSSDTGGNFNVLLPGQVYSGGTSTVGLSWSGLTLGHRYLSAVQLLDPSSVVQATTVLRVETNGGLPVTEIADSGPVKAGASLRKH